MLLQVDPRLLFATHYHPLCAEFAGSARVTQGHMAALVGPQHRAVGADDTNGGGGGRTSGSGGISSDGITFLYSLQPGPCPKSYGLQVHCSECTAVSFPVMMHPACW